MVGNSCAQEMETYSTIVYKQVFVYLFCIVLNCPSKCSMCVAISHSSHNDLLKEINSNLNVYSCCILFISKYPQLLEDVVI